MTRSPTSAVNNVVSLGYGYQLIGLPESTIHLDHSDDDDYESEELNRNMECCVGRKEFQRKLHYDGAKRKQNDKCHCRKDSVPNYNLTR